MILLDLNVARRGGNRTGVTNFNPAIDVHENENEFNVIAELPVRIFFKNTKYTKSNKFFYNFYRDWKKIKLTLMFVTIL